MEFSMAKDNQSAPTPQHRIRISRRIVVPNDYFSWLDLLDMAEHGESFDSQLLSKSLRNG